MALYYTINYQSASTNATPLTELDMLRTVTGATRSASFVQVIVSARSSTVGGGTIRLRRYATASTTGTAITAIAKDPGGQATTITAATLPTAGTTATQVMSIGFSQTGAQGFWGAAEPNDAVLLNAGGGANGNLDFFSIANANSVPFDLTTEHIE